MYCRASNPNLCVPVFFIATVLEGTEVCMEQPTGLKILSQLTMDIAQTFPAKTDFMRPLETTTGSCGPFIYSISPLPELFEITGGAINVLPGLNTTLRGTNTFTLTASYLNFPGITTTTPFTVTFTD